MFPKSSWPGNSGNSKPWTFWGHQIFIPRPRRAAPWSAPRFPALFGAKLLQHLFDVVGSTTTGVGPLLGPIRSRPSKATAMRLGGLQHNTSFGMALVGVVGNLLQFLFFLPISQGKTVVQDKGKSWRILELV